MKTLYKKLKVLNEIYTYTKKKKNILKMLAKIKDSKKVISHYHHTLQILLSDS